MKVYLWIRDTITPHKQIRYTCHFEVFEKFDIFSVGGKNLEYILLKNQTYLTIKKNTYMFSMNYIA